MDWPLVVMKKKASGSNLFYCIRLSILSFMSSDLKGLSSDSKGSSIGKSSSLKTLTEFRISTTLNGKTEVSPCQVQTS